MFLYVGSGQSQCSSGFLHREASRNSIVWTRKIGRLKPLLLLSLSAQVFHANADATEVVLNRIPQPVLARFVRIRPQTWKNGIALRFELYGCQITGKKARKRSCYITCQYVMIYEH